MTIIRSNDNEYFNQEISEYFNFLISDFGFIKFPEYQIPHEVHNDFIKSNIIIKLVYDGGYWVNILKPLCNIDNILNLSKCTWEYEYNDFKRFELINLDRGRKIYNSVSSYNFMDKDLWYYSKLLKENPEILMGNFEIFSFSYRIKRRIRTIFK